MPGRPWSQDKLGPKTIPATGYEDARDPGMGEKVPRCAACGMPETRSMVGVWDGDGRRYHIRLCGRCVGQTRQPDPDPLDATEAA